MDKITIFRGSTFTGSVTLRLTDPCNSDQQNPVPIDGTDVIQLKFPGITSGAPVILSTANSGEITITDANGTFSYKGSATKSLLLGLSAAAAAGALDCIVTRTSGVILIFEQLKLLIVQDPAVT